MDADSPQPRYTLRDLPLPAKLVVTTFLLSVALGYLSAMIQLHFKHASKGKVLPTLDDVVMRFSGRLPPWNPPPIRPPAPAPAANPAQQVKVPIKTIITERCVVCHSDKEGQEPFFETWEGLSKFLEPKAQESEIHHLITADEDANWGKGSSMRQAFHKKGYIDGEEWDKAIRKKNMTDDEVKALTEAREIERLGLVAWLEAGAPRAAYEKNSFSPQADDKPVEDPNDPVLKAKRRQMSVESLTQSTHAHLLTFSILWALTGFIFAFTSYPYWMRIGIAPLVLVAQVADVCCWWLARLPHSGPYFAAAIMGTGAIVGVWLMVQIVLSMFNLYGRQGKMIVAALFLGAGIGMAVLAPKVLNEVKAENPAAQG